MSPCLCAGTMGLVHLECLNMWRLASSNPLSFYQCDQCHYRYSFQRALYATILRSALMLHVLMLAGFATTVLGCSFIAKILDQHYGGVMQANVSTEFLEHLANETDLEIELLKEQLQLFHSISWHGIHLVHLFSGLLMVGVSGFVSMGFYWFPLFGGPGHTGIAGPLMVLAVVITGTVRVMFGIYKGFKALSGWLLRSAESMILEVGVGVDERCPLPPQEAPQQPAAADNAAGNAADDVANAVATAAAHAAADTAADVAANVAVDGAPDALVNAARTVGAGAGRASTDGNGGTDDPDATHSLEQSFVGKQLSEAAAVELMVHDRVERSATSAGTGLVGDADLSAPNSAPIC